MSGPIIAILLGRKGSKGVRNKNTMKILGRPAFHYPIMAALNSKYVDTLFVSTDDKEIATAVKKFDLEIINRPTYLCTDEALFEEALVHAYREAKKRINTIPKYIVVLMCNAVTIDSSLIDEAINLLEEDKKADSAVTVSIFNMYSPLRARKIDEHGYLVPFVPFKVFGSKKKLSCDRNSQGDAYFADMSHSVVRPKCLENIKKGLLPQRWMGQRIIPVMNNNGCDIDEGWQIDMSLRWLKNRGFSQSKTIFKIDNYSRFSTTLNKRLVRF